MVFLQSRKHAAEAEQQGQEGGRRPGADQVWQAKGNLRRL